MFVQKKQNMHNIYLPELLKIRIQNYTLYPKGLDYEYKFVKGINLVLGGNGMGKTTFVNLIKYAILGHYKKNYDFVRTYLGKVIEKRRAFTDDYFRKREDKSLKKNTPTVLLSFKINNEIFDVKRDLDNIKLISFSINGIAFEGATISENKYDQLDSNIKHSFLQFKYEEQIEKYSNLTFDDLIFFVNEILFFGENHDTILWNEGNSNDIDVQNELFNKYFNEPDLDKKRQKSLREAKYHDSLSRHKSEDARAIRNAIKGISERNSSCENPIDKTISLKENIESIENKIENNQQKRINNSNSISLLQNEINSLSLRTSELDNRKDQFDKKNQSNQWKSMHPYYNIFIENITSNHVCPICNNPSDTLTKRLMDYPTKCFVCGQEIKKTKNLIDIEQYRLISEERKRVYKDIQIDQKELSKMDSLNKELDDEFQILNIKLREKKIALRNLEFLSTKDGGTDNLIEFQNEIDKLMKSKDDEIKKSTIYKKKADDISKLIEEKITKNVKEFSSIFSSYANAFLGVKCGLTYDTFGENKIKRFYPIIDGSIRENAEELSESQRFFVDHSFRMSILSFFYNTPAFYIAETPDSSLDISYENNAANVFLKFLENPNILILTSNLNNSSFIKHLMANRQHSSISVVRLFEIARQSKIQNTSEILNKIYIDIINKCDIINKIND